MSAVSSFTNVYGEPAVRENLSHIYDIMNEKNEERIILRDFTRFAEYVGLQFDKKEIGAVYSAIAGSVKKGRYITADAWLKGIKLIDSNANVRKLYGAILSGQQYDPQPHRSTPEIEMEELRVSLKTLTAAWTYRVECMESLCRQLTVASLTDDKFHAQFRNFHTSLLVQAKDRRSNVSRVACHVLAKMIRRWGAQFLTYSYTAIEYMFELVRQKIKVVHDSGFSVLVCLLKHCGDHKAYKMMAILGREGTSSKFVHLKVDCFELLLLYVQQQNAALKSQAAFWTKLTEYCKKGVADTADVRNSALQLLAHIEQERPALVKDVIGAMNAHVKKRYDTEYRMSGNSNANGFAQPEQKEMAASDHAKAKKKPATASAKSMKISTATDSVSKNPKMKTPKTPVRTPKTPSTPNGGVKKKGKASSFSYPKAPPGQFLNGFGELLDEDDLLFAFEFIDFQKDKKITADEFETACRRLNVAGDPTALFSALDEHNTGKVTFPAFTSAVEKRGAALLPFWTALLSGAHVQRAPLDSDLVLSEANKVLLDLKKREDERLAAMHSIVREFCNLKKWENLERFEKEFKKSIGPLLNQLKDAKNSSIVRECCVCLATLCLVKQTLYKPFVVRTAENLVEVIKLQDKKMHRSGEQAMYALLKYVPDRQDCPVMQLVSAGCCDKNFPRLRLSGFVFVDFLLSRMMQSGVAEKKKAFWECTQKVVQSGLNDGDPSVRELAFSALVKLEAVRSDLAQKYIDGLKKNRKEKYEQIKQQQQQQQQALPVHKRPKDDVDEDDRKTATPVLEAKRMERERFKQPKEARLETEFVAQGKRRSSKLEQQKLETVRKEQEDLKRREKAAREKAEREKAEQERRKQAEEAERMQREQRNKQDQEQRMKHEQEKKEQEQQQTQVKAQDGNDFGFPKVHACYMAYHAEKGVFCDNPTHLVLYAKRTAMGGVAFSKVNKYLKAVK